jgi:hypothetical protein
MLPMPVLQLPRDFSGFGGFIGGMRVRPVAFIAGFALVALLGYWLAGTAAPRKSARESPVVSPGSRMTVPADEPPPRFRSGERPPAHARDTEAAELGAIEGQRVLAFASREAMERFLARMGGGVKLLGRLDALNMLRLGFSDYADLAGLLDGNEELSFIFPVTTPPLPDGSVQPGAMALGARLLDWLGINGDHPGWGAGVRIAVLDTGVLQHPAFQNLIRSINLIDFPADLSLVNSHGTAVASLIAGSDSLTPGVAPGAEILSIRVANDFGQSDSFLLAQGIVAAVDAGVALINISMGSLGESAVLRNAIQYAQERGVMIFAAAGNNGIGQVYYPAASEGVFAVGAVDASGNHMAFSNTGNEIAISAPGYGVNAAWSTNQAAMVSGTSFSTPIVAGAVAAVMSATGVNAATAWQMILQYSNDSGLPGPDPLYGAGMPDIGRVLAAGTPGIYDAAVASQRILPPDASYPYGQVEILVQNRGTEMLINTSLQVSTGGSPSTHNITTLAPNAVTTVRVPVMRPTSPGSDSLQVDARVGLSGGFIDAKPANDRRIEIHAPADSL